MTGATLSEVYQQARHSLLIVRDGLERLERLEFPQGPPLANSFTSDGAGSSSSSSSNGRMVEDHALGRASPDLIQVLKRDLSQLENHCVEMERLWRLQLPKTHRDLWKRKIEQVAEEVDALKTGLDKYLVRQHRRQLEAQERANLFQRVNGDSARVLEIFDAEQVAVRSARNSSTMLEDALSTGAAVLAKYAEQRERLKVKVLNGRLWIF
ncbi:hypothetical protein O6H91_07G119000 [Diphasiastrum complanatum]|uniref:Uncharacterized protein n=1 Tax=Diphasiastrum complanatum TaxID=34168 RepID=A0ACC2D9A9_DIPCM|nr:hypothetical protein O6H91_07G119000 [Diphasiastrum complanatum]